MVCSLKDNIYARVEKILVDLLFEMKKINFMDKEEYIKIFSNIITNYRINLAKSLVYAYSRKKDDEIKEIINEII